MTTRPPAGEADLWQAESASDATIKQKYGIPGDRNLGIFQLKNGRPMLALDFTVFSGGFELFIVVGKAKRPSVF